MPARTLSLVLSRAIDGGMHEDFELTNHGRVAVHFNLEDRDPQRFRRHLRGEVGADRAPRPHHQQLVATTRAC